MSHFVGEYYMAKIWFVELGGNIDQIWKRLWDDEPDEVKEREAIEKNVQRERKNIREAKVTRLRG